MLLSTIKKLLTLTEFTAESAVLVAVKVTQAGFYKRNVGKVKGVRYFRRYESPWIALYLDTNPVYPAHILRDRF